MNYPRLVLLFVVLLGPLSTSWAALVVCPECSRRVSSEAGQCPGCGLPGTRLRTAKPATSFTPTSPSSPSTTGTLSPSAPGTTVYATSTASEPDSWFDSAESALDDPLLHWNPVFGKMDVSEDGLVFTAAKSTGSSLQLQINPPSGRGKLFVQVLLSSKGTVPVTYRVKSGGNYYYSEATTSISSGQPQNMTFWPNSGEACLVTFTPPVSGAFTVLRLRVFWNAQTSSTYYSSVLPELTAPVKPKPTSNAEAKASVLALDGDQGATSGFLARIGKEALIFSNHQSVGLARALSFKAADGRRISPIAMEVAAEEDAVRFALSAEDALTLKTAFAFATGEPDRGSPLTAYAVGKDGASVTEVSGLAQKTDRQSVEIAMPMNRASNGGPICNRKGEVVGIGSLARRSTDSQGEYMPVAQSERRAYRVTPQTKWLKVTPQTFVSQVRLEEDIRRFVGAIGLSLDHIRVVEYGGGEGSSAPFVDARYLKLKEGTRFHEARWGQMLENFSQRFAIVEGKGDRRLNPSEIQRHATNLRQEYGRLLDLAAAEATKGKWVGGYLAARAKETSVVAAHLKARVNSAVPGK